MKIWIIKTGEQTELDNNARLLRSGQIFENLKKENYDITWFNITFNHQIKKQRFFKTTILKKKKNKIIYLYGNSYKNNISLSRFFSQLLNAIEFFKYVKNGGVYGSRKTLLVALLSGSRKRVQDRWFRVRRNV